MGNFSLLFGRYDDGGRRFFAATLTSSQIFCYEDLEFYLAFESTVFSLFLVTICNFGSRRLANVDDDRLKCL